MAATYAITLCDDTGRRLMTLDNLRAFTATRIVNGVGAFSAALKSAADLQTLQKYHYVERNIRPDWQIRVWRKGRGPMRLWRSYFLLNWGWGQDEGGDEVFSIGGYDANHLLTRRNVIAFAGSPYSQMSDYADDMMKLLVFYAESDAIAPTPDAGTRAWTYLTIDNELGAAPSVTLGFAWEKLLTLAGGGVLTRLANASRELGTALFFDVVAASVSSSGTTYQFRTYTGQPGRDLTSGKGQVVFDADAGTLLDWSLSYDYSEEENYIYALGQGDEDDREVVQVYDAARYGRSIWGRCEGVADLRNLEDAYVEDGGNDALVEGRPKIQLRGTPVSTQKQEFGRHYDVGDRVIAKAKGKQFTALVAAAAISLNEEGRVTETARLEYDE